MSLTEGFTRHATRSLFCCLAFASLLAISAEAVRADPIVFSGSTQGSFNNGAFGSTATLGGLTFTGVNFTAPTDQFGRLGFAGPNFIVGYLSAGSSLNFAPTDRFHLLLSFDPAGGISPNPVTYTAGFGVS